MATSTYTPIASITLGSSASSVTFSSIPQDYRDLVLVYDGFADADVSVGIQLNSDTGSNYSTVRAFNTTSGTLNETYAVVTTGNPVDKHLTIINIFDYSATDKHKTILNRDNSENFVAMHASRWADTSAVTSVTYMNSGANNFTTGTTFALYGIAS